MSATSEQPRLEHEKEDDSMNILDTEGWTCLHTAAQAGDLVQMQPLLAQGATVDAESAHGWTPLHIAASYGQVEAAQLLLSNGADIDYVHGDNQQTPLHCAAARGTLAVVQLLVEQGAALEARDNLGMTPLMSAANRCAIDIVKFLCQSGANIDNRDIKDHTALCWAATTGPIELVDVLVDNGADLNAKGANGWFPLYTAAFLNYFDIVMLLMKKGANLNERTTEGLTAINHAAYEGNMQMLEILAKGGAALDIKSNESLTPLHNATMEGKGQAVKVLLEYGADMNITNNQGEVPLHDAARAGNFEIVELLVEHGADLERKNKDSMTPLTVAAENGQFEITRYLMEHGAHTDNQSSDGWTPAAFAALYEHNELFEIMEEHLLFLPEWFIDPDDIEFDDVYAFDDGETGSVHTGTWRDRPVAIQIGMIDDQTMKGTFLREVRTWYRLDHPHLLPLLGACHLDQPFYVFEYATYGSIHTFFQEQTNKRGLWRRLHEAALGLQYLHDCGILHGSLTCNSILIGDEGTVKLTGFGFNTVLPRVERKHKDEGLVPWKPPESFYEMRPWFESDVYSFSRCILEVVTGERPWGKHVPSHTIMHQVKCAECPERPDGFSDTQWDLVLRMCPYYRQMRLKLPDVIRELEVFAREEEKIN